MLERASRSKATQSAELAELPVGEPVAAPAGRLPDGRLLFGRTVTVEPLDPARHAFELWQSFHSSDPEGRIWTYMAYGPFAAYEAFRTWVEERAKSRDPYFYAIVPRATGRAAGMASLMRITPEHGVIEAGNIWFAPSLQRTREATEAIFLLVRHAFEDLGYRRFEWKCDALNAASRRAAERLGFSFEGIFRQHMIYKGRNRDTAWYAILDKDWPAIRDAFKDWLRDENFDAAGRQRKPLSSFLASFRNR
jgi:RimJ/RimL family protein N-acetyltransferase